MNESTPYSINTDVRFGPLQLIDVRQLAGACKHQWFNQTLCRVNDSVVRMGVLRGEFHWHKHDVEDEFFYVVEGRLTVEYEDRRVTLSPQQAIMVPRGVMHRTLASERTVVLMVEGYGVTPTGDSSHSIS
jgi:mannose-6-phosphate isomerase-like protein (cupin superfamily)